MSFPLVLPSSVLDKSRPAVIRICAWLFFISGVILIPVSAAPLVMNFKLNAWAFFTVALGPLMIVTANRMWSGYDEFFLLGIPAALPLVPVAGLGILLVVLCVKGFSASRAWWPDPEEIWGEDAHIPLKEGGMQVQVPTKVRGFGAFRTEEWEVPASPDPANTTNTAPAD